MFESIIRFRRHPLTVLHENSSTVGTDLQSRSTCSDRASLHEYQNNARMVAKVLEKNVGSLCTA